MRNSLWKIGFAPIFIGFIFSLAGLAAKADGLPGVISVSEDHRIRQWDGNGKAVATIGSQDEAIHAAGIAPAPDGPTVVTGDAQGTLKIWDIGAAHQIFSQDEAHRGGIFALAVSPDGKYIATGGADRHIRLWRRDTGRKLADADTKQDAVRALRFFTSGGALQLLSGSADNIVQIWKVEASGNKGELNYASSIPAHDDSVTALALSPDGKSFASVSKDKWLKTWHSDGSGLEQRIHSDHALHAVAYSPDGKTIAAGDDDGHIRLYDAQKGNALPFTMAQERAVRALIFSADGKILVSGGDDRKIHYWDAATGKEKQSVAAHDGAITALLLAP